ncbi:MAG: hypothetical protein GY810_23250 [Aureispira sp.]|nr:hypothetical protein [Aureispira sp.]
MATTYADLSANSRVWVYQSNKELEQNAVEQLKLQVDDFTKEWASHNVQLKAWGDILHNRFVVFMVDESQAGASGCSIDKSVAFIKNIETNLGVDMFDRWNFAYKNGDKVEAADRDDFVQLYNNGQITDETTVFNNLVTTKDDFEQKWQVKLSDSWHKRLL